MVKPKQKQSSAVDAEAVAVEYLKKQNRPYNSTDIFNNLKGMVSKTNLNKALTDAAAKGLIHCKNYSKGNSIYCAKQDEIENLDQVVAEVSDAILSQETKLSDLNEELKAKKRDLNGIISSGPPTTELFKNIFDLITEISRMQAQIESARSGKAEMEPEELEKIITLHKTAHQSWIKRKKMCMDAFNIIAENADLKTESLMDMIGLEVDP